MQLLILIQLHILVRYKNILMSSSKQNDQPQTDLTKTVALIGIITGALKDIFSSISYLPFYIIFYQYITNSYLFSKQYEILPHDGYIDAGYHILKYQGFFSFWRGITFYFWYIISGAVASLLCIRFPEQIRNLIKDILSYPFLFAFIAYVIDPAQTFTGFFAQIYLLKKIIIKKGILSIFTGMGCYLIATHTKPMSSYILSKIMPSKQVGFSYVVLKILSSGPLALLLYPFIYVQCRMIAAICYGKKYGGMISCFSKIIAKQGWTILFTGCIFHVIVAVLTAVILSLTLLSTISAKNETSFEFKKGFSYSSSSSTTLWQSKKTFNF